MFSFILFILLQILTPAFGNVFQLSDLQWTLRNQNGSIVIPATVPSQAHIDLLEAGIITEPLLGVNDFTERWIINENWTYTASLEPFMATLERQPSAILLVFYGLDTIANITVTGHPVAWVNNQFRQYVFDVSDFILCDCKEDFNITVDFESAFWYGKNVSSRADAEGFPGTNGDFEIPGVRHWIRKVASDFGWDWGPGFVPSGIYKPAYLITLSEPVNGTFHTTSPPISPSISTTSPDPIFIEESSLDIYKVGQNFSTPPDEKADWILNVSLAIRTGTTYNLSTLTLAIAELNITSEDIVLPLLAPNPDGPTWVTGIWRVDDSIPERWYPHNLGNPKLYNVTVTLTFSNISPSTEATASIIEFPIRTGFRTVQLVQSPYSNDDIEQRGITPGDQWHFNINGKAFYSLGTNIIPFDPFYARTDTEKVRWILESAVKSGQNMLRVWGGGMYQPSDTTTAGGVYDFYSTCDELGILAWSEFIFSDALYPINDFMLESIEPEVRQNVRRVNKHPSNVQWAGGNEIEGIVLSTNSSQANGSHYLNEFITLFQHFLHDITISETHSVPYTDCSTTKGVLSLDPYELRLNNGTSGDIYGNSERYDYDATRAFNYSTFPVSRFVNEFGYHSMPSFYTWEEVLTSPDDFFFNSTVVMSRDHHPPAGGLVFPNPNAPEGQAEMTRAVELWLPTPSTQDTNQTFAQWCWSTQIFQTMTMVSEISWYRRGAGQGENNLGALVWQLNDIWQGVSWSSIEYSGRWKVLQYGMTNAFSSVVINPFWTPENETFEVLVTSDRWHEVTGTTQLTWYDWFGTALNSTTHQFTVPSLNNSMIFQAVGLDNILPEGKNASDVWLLLNSTAEIDGRTVTSEQYFTPTSLANAPLIDPIIHVTRGTDITFTLSAQGGVAPWTWIDHPAGTIGHFVDNRTGTPTNGFYLVPGIDRTLRFVVNTALTKGIQGLDVDSFVVRSLWNNTHA